METERPPTLPSPKARRGANLQKTCLESASDKEIRPVKAFKLVDLGATPFGGVVPVEALPEG